MRKISFYILATVFLYIGQLSAQIGLSLEQSKQLALKNNAESKNSKLEVKAAGQTRQTALTKYFPSISAGGIMFGANKSMMEIENQGGNLPVYDGNPASLAGATEFAYFPSSTVGMLKKGTIGFINIIQPIFTGGRTINGNKLAVLGVEAAKYKNRLTKDEILLSTEKQYWQIVSLEEKSKTINKYEEMLRRLLAQVEDAFKSGLVMKNDVLKVRLKLNEVLLNKSKLDNGEKLAEMSFCQFLGISYDSTLKLNSKLVIKDLPQSLYVDNSAALKNRNEYKLLKLSVKAHELQKKIKIGEYLPQVGIGVSGMYMKFDDGAKRTLGMVFGTVSVPISGWWGGTHEIEEKSIKEQIAENNFKNNSELLLLQMQKAWQDLNDAYKQFKLSKESEAQAKENLKVNEDSYKNGLSNVSDLLEAQALLQKAQNGLADSKANYLIKETIYLQSTCR